MEELYRQNAKMVYHFLWKMCGDQYLAEELTQETFLQAYKSIERYDGSCKISVWLCQIAKHLYYQYLEKHKRELAEDMREKQAEDAAANTEKQALTRMELLEVLKEMQELPDKMREVMYLRMSTDLSFREIGEILGKSENWTRVNFYRGKERLLKGREEK